MKLPCILKTTGGHVVCLFENGFGYHLDGQYKGVMTDDVFCIASSDKNITAEYLTNTYGTVESKEHAEFIKLLASNEGIKCNYMVVSDEIKYFYFSCGVLFFTFCREDGDRFKQITIPLPPKEKSMESQKEWPQVGDDVETSDGNGVVKLLPDSKGYYIVSVDGEYYQYQIDELSKPKTPEQELRDELVSAMDDSNTAFQYAEYLAKYLLDQYTLTKKPQ